jgi:diphosphomevalonate decarboxylase
MESKPPLFLKSKENKTILQKEDEIWVSSLAPINIALIKYWGKLDDNLIIPLNSSISITLDANKMSTTTKIIAKEGLEEDELILNGEEMSIPSRIKRVVSLMRDFSRKEGNPKIEVFNLDLKKSVLISKIKILERRVRIITSNNFPTAAGLASSASGIAAIVYALMLLYGIKPSLYSKITTIARY